MSAPTTYPLFIEVAKPVHIAVGRLGTHEFPAGRYVYTGSAKRALEARIARHLRATKSLHWHIDHLLAAIGVKVVDVRRSSRGECALNRSTKGAVIVAGFGSSDCRAGCGSHFKFVGTIDELDDTGAHTEAVHVPT